MARARGIVSFKLVPLLVVVLLFGLMLGAGWFTLADVGDVFIAIGQILHQASSKI